MTWIDWIVLVGTLSFIIIYGVWKGRKNTDIKDYLLANRSNHAVVRGGSVHNGDSGQCHHFFCRHRARRIPTECGSCSFTLACR